MSWKFLILMATGICLLSDIECNANSTVIPDPCVTHQILDSSNRQHTIHENNGLCDSGLDVGWYKLEIQGRPAEIPNVCLQNNVCGTQLPLRIDLGGNAMPVSGEVLEASACTSYDVLGQWDCCVLRQPVRIKNCSTFYVYHLRPTDRCPVAYCAQEIGANPSDEVTRKRGDTLNGPVHSEVTTADSSNPTETTTDSVESVTTESSVSNVTSEYTTIIAPSTRIASSTNATTVDGFGSTTDGDNVTMLTSVMTETSATNVTTVEAMTMNEETVSPTSKDTGVSSTESTFVNRTQNTTANLECINWLPSRCPGNITCYKSPLNNVMYIVCADGSGCGALCDNDPGCLDESDENNIVCPISPVCSESQQLCSDGSACFTRCDGTITCNNVTAGEDEDGCFPTNITLTTETMTINATSPSTNGSFSAVTHSTASVSGNTVDQPESETAAQQPVSTTQDSFTAITAVENTTVSINVSIAATESSVASTEASVTTGSLTAESVVNTEGSTTSTNVTIDVVSTDSSVTIDVLTTETSVTTDGETENITVSHTTFTRLPTSIHVQESSTGLTRSADVAHSFTNSTTVVATTQSDSILTRSESESSMAILTTQSSTNESTTTNESIASGPELTESSIVTTSSSVDDYTSVDTVSTARALTVEPETTRVTESISSPTPTSQSSESVPQTTVLSEETSQSSSRATEMTTESTSSSIVTTESPSSSQDVQVHTSPEIVPIESTTSSLSTHRTQFTTLSTVSDVSTSPSSTESVQQSSADTVIVTESRTDSTIQAGEMSSRAQASVVSTSSGIRTVTPDELITSGESDSTTLADVNNTSVEFSSVTGPQTTSSAENQTDHTIYVTKNDRKGLFYENFGLFVFLIVAGAVIVGVCMFGIIGYTYQRRLRTWNPTMAYQDAYGDLEKTTLSFGRDKHGIDSPIPDFDILRDEKKFEETSLSQASTLAVGPSPGQAEPPFDDTYDDAFSSKITNGTPTSGGSQQGNEVPYITNGHTNEGFAADDNVDGIVPVDDLDTSPPRTLFPWIENAADTKL